MYFKSKVILISLFLFSLNAFTQNDLLKELESKLKISNSVNNAFKALKIVNLESTKLVGEGDLYFIIAHRFGSVKNGLDDLFGLDEATIRFSFFYGFNKWLNLGVSRSEFRKTYEASIKYRLIHQKKEGFPFTIVGFSSIGINTNIDKIDFPKLTFKHRLTYFNALLISRKINKFLSLEFAPIFIKENFVLNDFQANSQYVLAFGGSHKLNKSLSLNFDYAYHLNRTSNSDFKNPLSVGLDIQVGGHIFQLIFSNAQPLTDANYITNTTGNWKKADIFFGFNLLRVF
ncbi:MAG: DUF5777 family beta-barrel protein [Flavobacteriaceae bacterium]|nr:DUF5777 family beta-barrel protein [Flavobacteriaceae bacterium]